MRRIRIKSRQKELAELFKPILVQGLKKQPFWTNDVDEILKANKLFRDKAIEEGMSGYSLLYQLERLDFVMPVKTPAEILALPDKRSHKRKYYILKDPRDIIKWKETHTRQL